MDEVSFSMITVRLADADSVSVPVSIEDYDFELPKFSSFRFNMGVEYVYKQMSSREDAQLHGR